jgi:hypothetical protein
LIEFDYNAHRRSLSGSAELDNSSKKLANDDDEHFGSARRTTAASGGCAMRARQAAKLGELRQALLDEGYRSLDQQAAALGLGRSTTWVILQGHHKLSGLRAATLNRMLRSERIPLATKRILEEYIEEKCAGVYGHTGAALRKFCAQLDKLRAARRVSLPSSGGSADQKIVPSRPRIP